MMRFLVLPLLATMALMSEAAQTPPPPAPARAPGLYATIETSMGNIVAKLYDKDTPITVKNFVDLALGRKLWTDPKTHQKTRRPLYSGTIFHRVIPNFMIQAGDPTGTGMGDPGFTIPDEFLPGLRFDVPGRLGMANIGEPHTGASQFFITEVPTPHLNGKHTVFGQVISGQELVGKIARVPCGAENRPITPVHLIKITFHREGPVPPNAVEAAPHPVVHPAAKKAPTKK